VFAKYDGREHEDIGIFILPAIGMHAGLDAGLLQKLLPIPFLFDRHLRKQEALECTVLHEQPVLADRDLLNVRYPPKRREYGDFVIEFRQLRRCDRLKPWIAQGRERGRIAHRHVQRFHC